MKDPIVIVMVDFETPAGRSSYSMGGVMTRLKRRIATAYRRNGSEQEEIWIVAHRITRQT